MSRTRTEYRTVDHTIAGVTHQVRQPVTVPDAPTDWDSVALRAAGGLVLALTAVSIVWSTVSIGSLLHGGVGYAAAALFDLSWLVNILLEWLARFDMKKRRFTRLLGWTLLAATMGAILWHGLNAGSVALAVVGAMVSLFAKALWLSVMKFVDRDLSDADQQWVEAEVSRANASLAVASVRRMAARAESYAASELLAAEQMRASIAPASVSIETDMPAVALSAPADVRNETDTVSAAPEDNGGRPQSATLPQFIAPRTPADVRPDAPSETVTGAPLSERPATVAGAVRALMGSGMSAESDLMVHVPAMLGRSVRPDTIKREMRRTSATVTRDRGTGAYL
jgi:hypothetical protein